MADPRLTNYLFRSSLSQHRPISDLIGPFYRERSESQTEDDDRKIVESGMLFGDVPHLGGKCPTVQAYFGSLPPALKGIQFATATIPHQSGLLQGFGANGSVSVSN